jgi:hypothetical protein
MNSGALLDVSAMLQARFSKKRNRNEEEKSSSSRVVEGRRPHIENDGKGQSWRHQNRQGIEADTGGHWCNGSKTRGVLEYAGMNSATK